MELKRQRSSPKKYSGETDADRIFMTLIQKGVDHKTAAKQAQDATGLSLLTGQRMKTKGYGWQQLDKKQL